MQICQCQSAHGIEFALITHGLGHGTIHYSQGSAAMLTVPIQTGQGAALLWVADASGEPEHFSRSALAFLGMADADVAAGGWLWAVHPCDVRRVHRAWSHAVKTGTRFLATMRLRRADGVYRLHRAQATPEKDRNGTVRRWSATWTEIE
jgi:PAS domain-containing protein